MPRLCTRKFLGQIIKPNSSECICQTKSSRNQEGRASCLTSYVFCRGSSLILFIKLALPKLNSTLLCALLFALILVGRILWCLSFACSWQQALDFHIPHNILKSYTLLLPCVESKPTKVGTSVGGLVWRKSGGQHATTVQRL